jgi:hypothetical protein
MKNSPLLLLSTLTLCLTMAVPAFCRKPAVRELSDAELDEVSAAGFDIDINAVLAFRAIVEQAGIASGALKTGMTATAAASSVVQNNIAAIYSAKGDISGATIDNSNSISLNAVTAGGAGAEQNNLAVIAAQEGAVRDSSLNNVNQAEACADIAGISQDNIGIIIAAGNVENCAINNANQAAGAAIDAAATVESHLLSGFSGARNVLVTVTQGPVQRSVGVIVSLYGQILNSLIKNSNN